MDKENGGDGVKKQEKILKILRNGVRIMRMGMWMMRILVRMVMVRMPAAGSLGGVTRPISRAITDQVDLKYSNSR